MKAQTNDEIINDVMQNFYITEQQINLLKNRSNRVGKDLINYDLLYSGYNWDAIPVTYEQGYKGLRWLQGLIKRNGEPKAGQNLGYREIEIIINATPSDFSFVQLHNVGNRVINRFVPIYRCGAMDYFVYNGNINIIG